MTASHIMLQVTCFNATESDFQNFRTNWTNFRTLSEFQDVSGHFLKFQEFQDRAQACGHYLYLQTQFGEDRCMQFRVIMVTDPQTNI